MRFVPAAASSVLASLAVAFAVTPAPAAAASTPLTASSDACDQSTLEQLLRDEGLGERLDFSLGNQGALHIVCRRVDGDDVPDAVWLLVSGGTGGAFEGGIARSGRDGAPAEMVAVQEGHSRLMVGTRGGQLRFAWPVYRKGDPNCCASGGYAYRKVVVSGDGRVRLGKTRRTRSLTKAIRHQL